MGPICTKKGVIMGHAQNEKQFFWHKQQKQIISLQNFLFYQNIIYFDWVALVILDNSHRHKVSGNIFVHYSCWKSTTIVLTSASDIHLIYICKWYTYKIVYMLNEFWKTAWSDMHCWFLCVTMSNKSSKKSQIGMRTVMIWLLNAVVKTV